MQRPHHSKVYHTSAPSFHTAPKSPVSTTFTDEYIELFTPCKGIIENVVMKLIPQLPSEMHLLSRYYRQGAGTDKPVSLTKTILPKVSLSTHTIFKAHPEFNFP